MPKPSKFRPLKPLYQGLFAFDRLGRSTSKLTYAGRSDGIGAQVHSIFSLAAYAHLRGMDFEYAPLANVAHSDGNQSNWDRQWNEFFNFPQSRSTGLEECQSITKIHSLIRPKGCQVYKVIKAHSIVDLFPEVYSRVMLAFRKRYDQSSFQKKSLFAVDRFKIAVHLRRGDASIHADRPSSIEYTQRRLEELLPTIREKHPKSEILIFSQGHPEDFAPLAALGCKLALNEDVFKTFHSMVTADMLFTAKSSFSYAAALLSNNHIVYQPFWHPALPEWR